MRRYQCSSRVAIGTLANERSDLDKDTVTSNSRSESPSADDEEEDEGDDEDEDEDPESGDEYKNSAVNEFFRKEYQKAQQGSAHSLLREATPSVTPTSEVGARSSGRARRAVNYKERQVKDISFRIVQEAPKVRILSMRSSCHMN